jgi:DNA-binding NarL/FixJ family response regulator
LNKFACNIFPVPPFYAYHNRKTKRGTDELLQNNTAAANHLYRYRRAGKPVPAVAPDSGAAADAFADLTPQELAVPALVAEGMTNRQIAVKLYLPSREDNS